MRVFAFDQKDGEAWKKNWSTLGEISIYQCNRTDERSACNKRISEVCSSNETALLLIHQEPCAGLVSDVALQLVRDHSNLYVMHVTGGTQTAKNHSENHRIHYSLRKLESKKSLGYLSNRFNNLLLRLESAGNRAEVGKAWNEWESPAIERILELLSSLAMMPGDARVLSEITSRMQNMDAVIPEIASDELLRDYRDSTSGKMLDEFVALNEILTNTGMSGEIWANWIHLYPQALTDLSRRYL